MAVAEINSTVGDLGIILTPCPTHEEAQAFRAGPERIHHQTQVWSIAYAERMRGWEERREAGCTKIKIKM